MRLWIALRATVYASLFFSFWGWVAWEAGKLDKHLGSRLPEWATGPGLALVVIGALLGLIAAGHIVLKGGGTPAPFDPPRKFVPRGLFRFVRNPMYVGGVLLLVGFGLYFRSPAITLFGFVMFVALHLFVVLVEEPGLRKRFGEEYAAYCRTVPRWLPRFTRSTRSN